MNNPRYQYKQEAKELLDGKYEKPIIILLVFYVVNIIMTSLSQMVGPKRSLSYPYEVTDPGNPVLSTLLNVISFFVGAAIVYALVKLALHIFHKKEYTPENILLSGFKENFLRNAFLQFMMGLFIFLWSLLLIIPGLIKAYAYSMSFYLVNKEPGLDAMEAIDRSKKYTYGYKADLFMLDLSYLGWYILGLFTLGILWLWVIPKHQVARVMYYEEIYGNAEPSKPVEKKDELPELY